MATTLWMRHLRHSPKNPKFFNRDRFILSAGHGSMLLYSLLHLTGYNLPLSELQNFRQWGSKTPGHPENFMTPGVEMATGPLGQGIATSVGMAIAERFLAAKFNRPNHELISHFTYVICSDGDLMEGIGQEAASLAGHLGLGKLIWLYDSNHITIDGSTDLAYTENVADKFTALHWHVQSIDGMDPEAVDQALIAAKAEKERPSIIIARTIIGFGSPNKAGSQKSHGSPLGPEELALTKEALGLPLESFWVPDHVREAMNASEAGGKLETDWTTHFAAYKSEYPDEAALLDRLIAGELLAESVTWPEFSAPIATRKSSEAVLQTVAKAAPTLISGSADLSESVFTDIHCDSRQQASNPAGRTMCYGVREHAMAAAMNGITLHGGCRAVGGTFLIFSDYCKPSIRLAALMQCPTIFLFSHDSIGLGEDGPTHQPIEQLAGLRAIPNLNVMRPCDANESSVAWLLAMRSRETPSLMVTTRQNLPILTSSDIENHPAHRGAYILNEDADPQVCLLATGSEVSLAVAASEKLRAEGVRVRIVSMMSTFLFDHQEASYRESVLPKSIPTLSIEAASTFGWAKYSQAQVGIDHFGASAPASRLFEEFGFTPENVAAQARALLE